MDVSIIIVNYKTSKLINDCIRSIFEKTQGITYEIIIVDNATEELADVIDSAEDARLRLIQLPENVGFGRANNAGAQIASGRNLFFLNPDTLLLNNAIKILSDYLDTHPECGACGGNLYDVNLHPALSYRCLLPGIKWELNELLNRIPEKIQYGKNRTYNHKSYPIKVAYITGADLMIPKYVYDQITGFAPDFFMYYEETDLCSRIQNLKLCLYSVPNAHIQHLEGQSFTDNINTIKIQYLESGRLKYYARNYTKIYNWFANLIYKAFLISRIIILKRHKRQFYISRFRIFNGLLRFNL